MKKIIFKTSSNLGDIIYCIPFCKAVLKEFGNKDKLNMWLIYNHPATYNKRLMIGEHPSGDVTLTENGADMVKDLLLSQNYIGEVYVSDYINSSAISDITSYYEKTGVVVIDLELFRSLNIDLGRGSITRWYEAVIPTKTYINDFNNWLTSPKLKEYKDKIIIARSNRYRSSLKYKFLNKYLDNIIFIGVDDEYYNLQCHLESDNVNRVKITSFVQALSIINSCKLYIGNQTFFTALAEGLKVDRLVEVCPMCPNVITNGYGGHMITNQNQFETLVELYMKG